MKLLKKNLDINLKLYNKEIPALRPGFFYWVNAK